MKKQWFAAFFVPKFQYFKEDQSKWKKKNVQMYFRVTEEEKERIYQKMEQVGISSIGAYLRKMVLNGYCITMDMSDVKEMTRLLCNTANNINQYARALFI